MPAPSAARVATTKASTGGRKTSLVMITSAVSLDEAKTTPTRRASRERVSHRIEHRGGAIDQPRVD